jgi:hypothetical protein
MTDDKKQKFFYKGQFFENEEDFWESVKKWHENEVSEEDWDVFFKDLKNSVILNLGMWDKKLTGQQMNTMFEKMIKAFEDSV